MQINPASLAAQLVAAERLNTDALHQKQQSSLQAQSSAYSSLSSKTKAFQSMLKDLNDPAKMQAQKTTLSDEGFLTVTSNGEASSGQYNFQSKQVATSHQVGIELDGDSAIPNDGILTVNVGDEEMAIDLSTLPSNANAKDLADAINNSSSNPGVKATLVRTDGKTNLVMTSTETGEANQVSVNYTPVAGSEASEAFASAVDNMRELSPAQDAILVMGSGPGALEIKQGSNTFENVVDGLTIELTKAQPADSGPLQVSVSQDSEEMTEALKKFVDDYNELMDDLNKMTASGGALYGDSTARGLKSTLRNSVRDLPNGMTLSDIGIKTDREGKLSFSSTDFNKALEKDPEVLGKAMLGDDGLLKRMEKSLDSYTARDGIIKQREETIERSQKRLEEKMEAFDMRMEASYQRYLKQFTALNQMVESAQYL